MTPGSISIIIVVNFFSIYDVRYARHFEISVAAQRDTIVVIILVRLYVGMHVSGNCKIFTANIYAFNLVTIIINYMVRNLVTRRRIQQIGKQIVLQVMAFSMVFKWYVMDFLWSIV